MNGWRVAGCNVQYSRFGFEEFLSVQKRNGVTEIELWAGTPHVWCDRNGCGNLEFLDAALKAAGLSVTALSPRPYTYSLCAPFQTMHREATLQYYRHCIEAAARLGTPWLCLDVSGGEFDRPREDLWQCLRDGLEDLLQTAEPYAVSLALSVAPPGASPVLSSLKDFQSMKAEAGFDDFNVFFDTAHMARRGEEISQWFDAFGDDIVLVRFADGRNDGSRVWGEGCYPCDTWLEALSAAGYSGPLSLHVAGDRYLADPGLADRKNLAWLADHMKGTAKGCPC